MKKIFIITIIFCISCANKPVKRIYSSKHAFYGMFVNSLTLQCTGIAEMNFQGDLMNDKSIGKWYVNGDTLLIKYDSIKQRYNGDVRYKIVGNKLKNLPVSRAQYKKLIDSLKILGYGDTIKKLKVLKSYRNFSKASGQVMTDHRGTIKRQYLKLTKTTICK